MNIAEDLPFYIVVVAVFLNVLLGILTRVDFTMLMIRSIVVTIVFSVFGFILSEVLKSNKKKEGRERGKSNKGYGSTIDIQVPPIDESELLNYNEDESSDNGEDFVEVNPAYLHKFGQQEQNE